MSKTGIADIADIADILQECSPTVHEFGLWTYG